MAGLESVANVAIQALGAANTVIKTVDSFRGDSGLREYQQEKAMKSLELMQARQKADFEKDRIRIEASHAEDERREGLRRAIAKRRAEAGGKGIGSSDGSGEAVLLGLFEESEEDRTERNALDALKTAAANQEYNNAQRINTLQLAQLKERNKLKRAGSVLDTLTSIF